MIVVRDVFHLKFGKAQEAKMLLKTGLKIMKKYGYKPDRVLFDLTGRYYVMVLESSFKSLSAFEKRQQDMRPGKDWQDWYRKFTALVESGYREIMQEMK